MKQHPGPFYVFVFVYTVEAIIKPGSNFTSKYKRSYFVTSNKDESIIWIQFQMHCIFTRYWRWLLNKIDIIDYRCQAKKFENVMRQKIQLHNSFNADKVKSRETEWYILTKIPQNNHFHFEIHIIFCKNLNNL